jgi:uncharacterized protein YecT (DUF1311 family)
MRLGSVFCAALSASLLLPAQAAAGALQECYQRASTRLEVTPCLDGAKKAATDSMLEEFLAVSQSLGELERVTGRGGKVASLKQSQRDFERYLQSHCQVVLRLYDSGTGAGQAQLACEVDLLRQRAALLKLLAPTQNEAKTKE